MSRSREQQKDEKGGSRAEDARAGELGSYRSRPNGGQQRTSRKRAKREDQEAKQSGKEQQEDRLRLAPYRGAHTEAGRAAIIAVAGWAAVRAGVQLFHVTRRRQLTALLADLSGALRQLEMMYWLDYGALLGIHRDGDLILHDSDIDLAIWQPDWQQLEAGLRRQLPGYACARQVPSEHPDSLFLRVYTQLGFADLFAAAPVGTGRLLVDCGHGAEGSTLEEQSVFPLASMRWADADISVPGDIEAVLAQRYGPTWRVPRYLDKGADVIEHNKWWNKLLRGIRYCTGICV